MSRCRVPVQMASMRPARVQEDVCKSVIRSWLNEGHASLGLVVVGEAGQGKSSLINGLLGKEVAKEGDDLDPETQKLEKYSYEENGVAVSLWDSPGFGIDSDEKEEETLQLLLECVGQVDLMLYCIRMDGTRWPKKTDIATIRKMNKVFGPKIWQCCQFVLTFANQISGLCPRGSDPGQFFSNKVWKYEEKVRTTLMECAGLAEEDIQQVRLVPVGDPHYHEDKTWELPGIEDWFVNFWLECTCTIRKSALSTLIRLNKHRMTDMPEDVNSPNPPDTFMHPLPPSEALDTSETTLHTALEGPNANSMNHMPRPPPDDAPAETMTTQLLVYQMIQPNLKQNQFVIMM